MCVCVRHMTIHIQYMVHVFRGITSDFLCESFANVSIIQLPYPILVAGLNVCHAGVASSCNNSQPRVQIMQIHVFDWVTCFSIRS